MQSRKERNYESGSGNKRKRGRWANRTSSIKKKRRGMGHSSTVRSDRCVTCTTFNILAPIYKRISEEVRRDASAWEFLSGVRSLSLGVF